ncbi:hypothetical protein AND_005512 [Anopheles darlingi]|uniref:Uncharacterized protein n=1 Tax=Anopheles darlingi TaxID=43151 RepID=W5JFE1_ANODA|nr:hypothetical protein AND_005512 [Anopheles darlingi]
MKVLSEAGDVVTTMSSPLNTLVEFLRLIYAKCYRKVVRECNDGSTLILLLLRDHRRRRCLADCCVRSCGIVIRSDLWLSSRFDPRDTLNLVSTVDSERNRSWKLYRSGRKRNQYSLRKAK